MKGGVSETVDIATGSKRERAGFQYRLRHTAYTRDGKADVEWADSAACPAIDAVLTNMMNIKMPSPAPYGMPGVSDTVVMDATQYSLTTPSSDPMGKLTIGSIDGSPLAAWIDASLKKLAPCWRKSAS